MGLGYKEMKVDISSLRILSYRQLFPFPTPINKTFIELLSFVLFTSLVILSNILLPFSKRHYYLTFSIQRLLHQRCFFLIIFSETHVSSAVDSSQEDMRKEERLWDTCINSKYSTQVNDVILKRDSLNVILIMSHEYCSIL